MTTITIPVDPDSAYAFASASPEERRKLEILLRLRLKELVSMNPRSLRAVMDEMGAEAEAKGLTPNVLQELLRDP
jgi:hypothetical protein